MDSQGNVYVTGDSFTEASGYDYLTLKYSPGGQVLWDKRYNGPGNAEDVARSIAVDDDGNVSITGKSQGSSSFSDSATIKYRTSDGHLIWMQRYTGPTGP